MKPKKLKSVIMEGGGDTPSQGNGEGEYNGNSIMMNKSMMSKQGQKNRSRKEAKKLQKYDSNSIDEEEFQDCKWKPLVIMIDFSNP